MRQEAPWEILGIPENATEEEIQAAKSRNLKMFHPDKFPQATARQKSIVEEESKKINWAADEMLRRLRAQKNASSGYQPPPQDPQETHNTTRTYRANEPPLGRIERLQMLIAEVGLKRILQILALIVPMALGFYHGLYGVERPPRKVSNSNAGAGTINSTNSNASRAATNSNQSYLQQQEPNAAVLVELKRVQMDLANNSLIIPLMITNYGIDKRIRLAPYDRRTKFFPAAEIFFEKVILKDQEGEPFPVAAIQAPNGENRIIHPKICRQNEPTEIKLLCKILGDAPIPRVKKFSVVALSVSISSTDDFEAPRQLKTFSFPNIAVDEVISKGETQTLSRETDSQNDSANRGVSNPSEDKNPVTNVDEKPVPLNSPRPNYTEEARRNKIQGVVRVRVLVGADGSVKQATLLGGGLPDGLNEEAIRAAYQIRFKAAMKDGQSVAFWHSVSVEFYLR